MKTLLLMRHAKSSWKIADLADHERPLNKRGKKDSIFMGTVLKEKELLPQKILASTAVRIRETIAGLAQDRDFASEVEFSDALYLAEPEVFLQALCTLPDSVERVMLMGHNPGLEGLLQVLSGRIESLPTGSVAYLSLPIQQWSELSKGTEGELIEMLLPHELREMEEEKHKGKDKKADKKADKKENKKEDKKEVKKEDKKEDKKESKKEDKKEDKKESKKEDKKAELKEEVKEDMKAELKEEVKEDKKAEKKAASKEKKAEKKK